MATATTRTKQQARSTQAKAKATKDQAKAAGKQAERTIRSLVTDTAYATVGLGDTAVGLVKTLNQRAVETPKRIIDLRHEAPKAARKLREQATEEFDELTTRGRNVVGSVRANRSTQESMDRARTAKSQVKAAATSVGRAVKSQSEALEDAAESLGTSKTKRVVLEDRTVEQLQTMAAERDIEGRSQMNKSELITALRK